MAKLESHVQKAFDTIEGEIDWLNDIIHGLQQDILKGEELIETLGSKVGSLETKVKELEVALIEAHLTGNIDEEARK